MTDARILVINPGSTSTKIAVYDPMGALMEEVLRHSREELDSVADPLAFRRDVILRALGSANIELSSLSAVMCRGGLLRPLSGGVYAINDKMLADLRANRYGAHASNLGAPLGRAIGDPLGVPAYIADPTVVDELEPFARLSGYPGMERRSAFHALNQKAVARRYAGATGCKYEELDLIVAHIGGGCSVGAHRRGKVIDVNDALSGDGPYTAERTGGLPTAQLVRLCFSGRFPSADELIAHLKSAGGLMGYTGTNDGRELSARIDGGDGEAYLAYRGMAYQIAKEIGASAAVLCGKVDAVIITGGFAYDRRFVSWIEEMAGFIAPFCVMPGEDEMHALYEAGVRVLSGEETPMEY